MTLSNKVRVYDLAKELRQDTKRVIEDARREGVDVSVPSNSIPKEVAEKIRNKYMPKKEPVAHRAIKVVKRAARPEAEFDAPLETTPVQPVPSVPPSMSSSVATAPIASPRAIAPPVLSPKVMRKLSPPVPAAFVPQPEPEPIPAPEPPALVMTETPAPATLPVMEEAAPVALPEPIPAPFIETAPVPVMEEIPAAVVVVAPVAETPVPKPPVPAERPPAPAGRPPFTAKNERRAPVAPHRQPPERGHRTPSMRVAPMKPRVVTPPVAAPETPEPTPPANTGGMKVFQPQGPQVRQLRLTREALEAGLKHGERAPLVQPVTPPATAVRPVAEERKDRRGGRAKDRRQEAQKAQLVGTPGETATPKTTYIPPSDARGPKSRNGRPVRGREGAPNVRGGNVRGRFDRPDYTIPARALTMEERIAAQMDMRGKLKEARLVEGSTVKDFAEKLGIKPKEIVTLLLQRGVFATINQSLNADLAHELARRFGYEVTFLPFEEMVAEEEFDDLVATDGDDVEIARAPVVTVMGHVDHGKTSLLDAIRSANVASGEAGGITQHIGAYSVQVDSPDNPLEKRRVVFLDTPGHEAFTMMRARGAKATDVVVLVVAADDGVMPQTIEAIEHSKAAGVPIIVAINKVDKPEANPERVKQELTGQGLTPVEWGGETEMVLVSAKKHQNLTNLLETVLLTTDILDLKASPTRLASGVVLEAKLDRGRGSVATVLVQQGTLRVQDPFIVGQIFGKVRAMYNDRGETVTEAGPATPVEVLGLQGVPQAGDTFQVVSDTARAQQTAHHRQMLARQTALAQTTKRGIEALGQAETKELLVVIKADVQGSVEVLKSTLEKLSTGKVSVKVVRSGVGAITESDVLLASATQANSTDSAVVIIGFNVRPEVRAGDVAKEWNVEIRLHSVIYKVEEEIRAAMVGLLDAIEQEKILGRAEVRDIFRVPRAGVIAGCMVRNGLIRRTARARLVRDSIVVWEGNIGSLRRFKEDVAEVREGFECGIGLENFNDLKTGDQIEAYIIEKVAATEL